MMSANKKSLEHTLPYILLFAGIIGLAASLIILNDTFKLAANPNYHPSCSLNPIISCGSVMKSSEAHLFGFNNPYIGVAAFPVLITVGAVLLAGATLKRWFWLALNLGALLGVAFVHYLFIASVYHINALCPYCVVVWAMTIATFWYITLYNLRTGHITLRAKLKTIAGFMQKHHLDLLILWFLIITGLILQHFWYYFGRNL